MLYIYLCGCTVGKNADTWFAELDCEAQCAECIHGGYSQGHSTVICRYVGTIDVNNILCVKGLCDKLSTSSKK